MNELVSFRPNGEAVTNTLAIAKGTETQHKNVLDLVRTYQADLAEFGEVAFETRLNPQGSPTEFALLNREQATLLLTHMRSIGVVKDFKKALVKAFFELARCVRPAVLDPTQLSRLQILTLALEAEQKVQELACTVEAQAQDIAVLEPKAAYADRVAEAGGCHSFAEAARILGTGQNRLFGLLRTYGYLIPGKRLPYQQFVDNGLFKVRERLFEDRHGIDRLDNKTFITGKGMVAIQRRMAASMPTPMLRPQHERDLQ